MFKKAMALSLAFCLSLTVLAGCGGTKSSAAPSASADSSKTSGSGSSTPTTTTAAKDSFVWNVGVDTKGWDPGLAGTGDGAHMINNLFEGLMRDAGDGKLEYGMAESYTISEDQKTYTFKLRPNLKWSDGKPFTAKDFEYSWKRVCDPAAASGNVYIMAPYIVGADDFLNGKGTRDAVGVKATDDLTLVVNLNFPVPYFLSLTSFYAYLPVREDIVTAHGDGWEKNPETCISNGPFKLDTYKTADHIDFVKNENYWDAENVKLNKVHGLMIVEATTAFNGYQAGEIDLLDTNGIPSNEIPSLMGTDPYFSISDRIGTYFAVFNCDAAPFDDARVRRAFTLAINPNEIVEQVTKGGQKPASGYIPPSLKYSDGKSCRVLDANGMPTKEFGLDPYAAQVDEAKALLAEAGFPDGKGFPVVDYYYNTDATNKSVAEALQEMWKTNLGIDVGLKNEEWATFLNRRSMGDGLIFRGGWLGDYDDPMTMLDQFTSRGENDAQWRWKQQPSVAPHDKKLNPENKAFDDAVDKALVTSGAERDQWIKKAEQVMMDECIIAPIYYYTHVQIINESVIEGVKRNTMGSWDFKNAKLIA